MSLKASAPPPASRPRLIRMPNAVPARQAGLDAAGTPVRKRLLPDLSGRTIGTWRVLYETVVERRRQCMCQCVECGVRKIIPAFKLRQKYALRCRECRIRQELIAV